GFVLERALALSGTCRGCANLSDLPPGAGNDGPICLSYAAARSAGDIDGLVRGNVANDSTNRPAPYSPFAEARTKDHLLNSVLVQNRRDVECSLQVINRASFGRLRERGAKQVCALPAVCMKRFAFRLIQRLVVLRESRRQVMIRLRQHAILQLSHHG